MRVLIVGSVALDTIQTPLGKCKDVLGGSAVYSAISASYFSPVDMVAVIGQDFPSIHIKTLKKKPINLSGLKVLSGKTFRWSGSYGWDFSDAKTIATHLNVFSQFNPKLPPLYKNDKFLFLANIHPKIQENVLSQVKKPKLIVSDTMNYWIDKERRGLLKVLKKIDIFLLNESEARQLTSETNLIKAAKSIFTFGPKMVIIKKGEHGAILFSGSSLFCIPAFLLESVYDPTGAGDSFAGGLIGYLASCKKINDLSLKKAIAYGSIMATFAVESFSLKKLNSISKADINKRFKEFKKLVCF